MELHSLTLTLCVIGLSDVDSDGSRISERIVAPDAAGILEEHQLPTMIAVKDSQVPARGASVSETPAAPAGFRRSSRLRRNDLAD
jgi:hypothetical protein